MSCPRSLTRGDRYRWKAGTATALLATAATLACSSATNVAPAAASSPSSGPAVTVPVFSTNRLSQVKQEAAKLISDRLQSLQDEVNFVNGKSYLGSDGASLDAEMNAGTSGLEALAAKIAADSTVAEAVYDSGLIFSAFRVYLLMLPVAKAVIEVDYLDNVQVPYLANVSKFLQSNENSANEGVIEPLLYNIGAQVQIEGNATSGLTGQLLAFTPAQWDADRTLLNGPLAQVGIASRAISTALKDAAQGYDYLVHHHVPPTTSTTSSSTTSSTTTTTTPTTTTSSTTTSTTTSSTTTSTTVTTTTGNSGLGAVQAWAAKMISERVASLEGTLGWLSKQHFLGGDETALSSELQGVISGLEALGSKIAADTTTESARADANDIFSSFRTYDLVIPVAHDVASVDWVVNVKLPELQRQVSWLQARETGRDEAVIGPLVANMVSQGQAAAGATNGLSAELLGYTAAQWDANHRLLAPASADIFIADRAVQSAEKDYDRAVQYLRDAGRHRRS